MKLHEIIYQNDYTSIRFDLLQPYLKSLHTYFSSQFISEPVVMVVSVTNAAQYCKIVSADNLHDEVLNWIDDSGQCIDIDYISENYDNCTDEEQELFAAYETIMFNSKFLSELIK